jgi:hypothetical protein
VPPRVGRSHRYQHPHGGPGQFYITGPNAKFIDIGLLDRFVYEMVKRSPLQGSRFEVIPTSDEVVSSVPPSSLKKKSP